MVVMGRRHRFRLAAEPSRVSGGGTSGGTKTGRCPRNCPEPRVGFSWPRFTPPQWRAAGEETPVSRRDHWAGPFDEGDRTKGAAPTRVPRRVLAGSVDHCSTHELSFGSCWVKGVAVKR